MEPRRVESWGRLHREAVSIEPESGIVYMTEDRADGCFYRHIPDDPAQPMGSGRLQALCIPGVAVSDPYPEPVEGKIPPVIWSEGQRWDVKWVDIDDRHAESMACRHQAQARGGTHDQGFRF